MLRLFTGQLGGAVADLAGLIGEVVAVERVPDHLQRRRRQGPTDDRQARRGRDGAVRRRDRQPDDARGDRVQHDPGLARSTRARPASTRGTAARTGSRAWTSRATTPCRATSASRPDGRTGDARCSRPPICASRVATGRSSAARSVALAVAAWLALWVWEGVAVRALPPPRRRRRAAADRGDRSSPSAGC